MKRRAWLKGGGAILAGAGLGGCNCQNGRGLARWAERPGVAEFLEARRRGGLSATEAARFCLGRIRQLDPAGPRAVLEVNPDAASLAYLADSSPGGVKSMLAGLPVLLKDNIDTADRMQTTAGSLALLAGKKPAHDAFVARRLRESGAVLIGKANLSEWANIRSSKSISGWSARGGFTVNPFDAERTVSGSSSGSAAAVAAGLVPAAIGTETNGSIVSPASVCGVAGLKPTLGLVSRRGIIPITRWQDTAGPIARTAMDCALILNAIVGTDPDDPFTAEADARREADYSAGLDPDALRGVRVGVVRELCGTHEGVLARFEESLRLMAGAGAELVDGVEIPNRRDAGALAWAAMMTELRMDLNLYLEERGASVRSLAEVIQFNQDNAAVELEWFGQELFLEAERRGTRNALLAAGSARREAARLAGPAGLQAAMELAGVDVLVWATNDPATKIQRGAGDVGGRTAAGPPAVAGWPHLTVPMGRVEGLPVGLSFCGGPWQDGLVLCCGHAFTCALERESSATFPG
jgi:amidase